MRFFLLTLIAAGLTTLPFLFLKQPWAVGFWRKVQIVLVVYAVVIFVSAIIALIARWDDIYG
jgi:hypothetical protein